LKTVTVYSTKFCPYCRAAESLLDNIQVKYEKVDLTGDFQARKDLVARTRMRTVPQIFIGEELIGGFDELNALHKAGTLTSKLES
jgi:glutaredoxin 3